MTLAEAAVEDFYSSKKWNIRFNPAGATKERSLTSKSTFFRFSDGSLAIKSPDGDVQSA